MKKRSKRLWERSMQGSQQELSDCQKRNEAGMYSGLKPMGIPKKLDVTILTQKTETAQESRLMPEAGTCQTCGHTGTDVTERTYRVCDGTYVSKTECRNQMDCMVRWDTDHMGPAWVAAKCKEWPEYAASYAWIMDHDGWTTATPLPLITVLEKRWVTGFRGNREQFEMYLDTLKKGGELTVGELAEMGASR